MDGDMVYKKYSTEGYIIKDGFLTDAGENGGGISALIALTLYLLLLSGGLVDKGKCYMDDDIYKKYITEGYIIKEGFLIDAGDNRGGIIALIALILYLLLLSGGLVINKGDTVNYYAAWDERKGRGMAEHVS
eukprot:695185-Heterocapsa_arctica.AAC.1